MATPYRFKRSAVQGKRPGLTDLEKGELALNFYDGHLFAEVDTAGVGIGTTIPSHSGLGSMLTVNTGNLIGVGTSGAYVGYNMYYNSGNWKYQVGAASAILSFAASGDFSLRQATTGSAGGTISYSETLKVNRSTGYIDATGSSQVRLTLGSTGTAGTNTANWIRGNSSLLEFNSASSGFNWEIGGNAKVKINSSGNLGIGAGHDETRRNLGLKGSTPGVVFYDTNITNLTHEIVGGGNAGLEYSADYQNVADGYHRFDIGGAEKLRITRQILDDAKVYLPNQPSELSIHLAEQQEAGKGRNGKEWVSPKGKNI